MTLPTITNKQQEIILLLYRFRFLNRVQIQTLLHHKTFNRVIAWLNDLTQKKYIGKIVNNTSTINIIPTTYYIEQNGIRFLKDVGSCEKKYLYRLYLEHKKSNEFIEKCLLVANTYIELIERYQNIENFSFYTRSDFTVDGIIKEIFPHFVYRKNGDEFYIIEFLKEKPRFNIRLRIQQYINFFSNGNGRTQAELSKILLICPTIQVEDYVFKFTKKILIEGSSENLKIFVSTLEQIYKSGIEGQIWRRVE